ncbi:MAG: helix-turn-helix domain-containing protein [Planctomycetaceae bacterium]|nr:helix-turn-helix domain-containing protein [Planctomycetaceae bacterium]
MPAPTSDYYSLEKTAEVLGLQPAEINGLREKGVLRAFRDGTSWKFRKPEVDDYYVQIKKGKGKIDPLAEDGDGLDLLNSDDDTEEAPTMLAEHTSSFDSLMEDGGGIDDDLVLVKSETSLDKPAKAPIKKAGKSDVDLADDGLISESGTSSNLDLAGDSGLSLLSIAEDDSKLLKVGSDAELEIDEDSDLLTFMEDSDSHLNTSSVEPPKENEYDLADIEDDSAVVGGSSQAPAPLPAAPAPSLAKPKKPAPPPALDFGNAPADDFGVFNAPDGDMANDMFGNGVVPQQETPFAAEGAAPAGDGMFESTGTPDAGFGGFSDAQSGFPTASLPKTEAEYGTGTVLSLITLTVIMIFPGIMLLDLIRNIWSWNEPFVINSALMDMIGNMLGK